MNIYEELYNDTVAINSMNEIIVKATVSLEELSYLTPDDSYDTKKAIVEVAKTHIGYEDNVDISTEGISDFIKMLITKIKEFFSKMWKYVYKFIIKIKNFIMNDEKEIDDMIESLEDEGLSNEKYNEGIININIPHFLSDYSDKDKLAKLEYFFIKLTEIKRDTYMCIEDYIASLQSNTESYKSFNSRFVGNVSPNYNNDRELAYILSNIKDSIDENAKGNKYVLGYDKYFVHILMPKDNSVVKIKYSKKELEIKADYYTKNFLHHHLLNLKKMNNFNKKEIVVLGFINSKLEKVKTKLLKDLKKPDISKEELNTITKQLRDISNTIPNVMKTLETCSLSMYSEYKAILTKIYKHDR